MTGRKGGSRTILGAAALLTVSTFGRPGAATMMTDTDCAIRALGFEYGRALLTHIPDGTGAVPSSGTLAALRDAILWPMGHSYCNLSAFDVGPGWRPGPGTHTRRVVAAAPDRNGGRFDTTDTTDRTARPAARTVFVSAAAGSDDAGDGTIGKPFLTLQRAQTAVRTMRRDSGSDVSPGPVDVIIRAGLYQLNRTLLFGPEDGGTPSAPVTWRYATTWGHRARRLPSYFRTSRFAAILL